MISLSVTGGEATFRRLAEIGEDIPKAITRAINQTLAMTKTRVARGLAADVGLPYGAVSKVVRVKNASWTRWIGTLDVSSKRIPLISFKARQTQKGVTYAGAGGRGLVPSAFIRTVRSLHQVAMGVAGHLGVFARRGKKRLPIVEQFGPSLQYAWAHSGLIGEHDAYAAEIFPQKLDANINWIIQQRAESGDGSEAAA